MLIYCVWSKLDINYAREIVKYNNKKFQHVYNKL